MRKFWKDHGELENKNALKWRLYHKDMRQADWDFLCDHFGSEDQLTIFEKNAINRSKRPMEGAHGSKTLVQHYHDAANPVTGDLPSAIDTFEQLYRKGDQLKNDFAASKFAEMVEIRASQPEEETDGDSQGGSTMSASSTAGSRLQPKDIDIMTQVMGPRSRYVKGLGPLPKLSVAGGHRATNISDSSKEKDRKIATLEKTVSTQQQTIDAQNMRFEALESRLNLYFPGFSNKPLPTCSSARPPPLPPPPPAPTM